MVSSSGLLVAIALFRVRNLSFFHSFFVYHLFLVMFNFHEEKNLSFGFQGEILSSLKFDGFALSNMEC